MTTRPYHHGHLRTTLLAEAERALREDGVDGLSLRELARRAGVSHAAPRRHFPDRQALLDALGEAGFVRLGDEMLGAVADAGPERETRLRAMAVAYVRFAVRDSALLDVMFAKKKGGEPVEMGEGALRLFAAVGEVIREAQAAGVLPAGDPERLRLLLVAMLQGIAVLVTSGRAPVGLADSLAADAVALFTGAAEQTGM
ncbi:TetR/AcrR family transcriptional regulator [Streptomyces sp. NBC_00670]|jgi:AcrR family transcriptional regulator|uniref:TetR/AcrR family transcriptional regulator n=1 Tax=Streptomyces sp. NBC_00670 TaxID=2975804 RepID=UPI002E2F01C7|nr:TetR/AcrR family transcriptional regulator [Streptomyces sp. NBC_00670]